MTAPLPRVGAAARPPAPSGPWSARPPAPSRPWSARRPEVPLLVLGVLVLLLVALGAFWAASRSGAPTAAPPAPSAPPVAPAGGGLAQQAARADTDCAAHAYGDVRDFLAATPCVSLDRAVHSGTALGAQVVVSVASVRMPSDGAAEDLHRLVDTDGTGNVADLLREGVVVPGGPAELDGAGYASRRDGSLVVVVESDFTDPRREDAGLLDRVAAEALPLGGR